MCYLCDRFKKKGDGSLKNPGCGQQGHAVLQKDAMRRISGLCGRRASKSFHYDNLRYCKYRIEPKQMCRMDRQLRRYGPRTFGVSWLVMLPIPT